MADFKDALRKKVQGRLKDRQEEEARLAASIKANAEKVEQLEDKIEAALNAGGANAGAAVDSLNRDHLIDQIIEEQQALDNLRATPLYSLPEYEEECKQIRAEYLRRSSEIKVRLAEKLEEGLLVMDEADALRKEANGCVRELRQACAESGMDVKKSAYNGSTVGQFIFLHEREYRATLQNVIRGLKR